MQKQVIRKPLSNLNQVLQGLNSAGQNDLMNFLTASAFATKAPAMPSERNNRNLPELKLITDWDTETEDTWGRAESTAEQQVQQLLQHVECQRQELERCDHDLYRRESELQNEIDQWQRQKELQQVEIDQRQTAIWHHQQQIERQQAQLVKLQQGLVDTQVAVRKVIEKIVENCDADSLQQEIQELRFEFNESFERNFHRWESLRRSLLDTVQHSQ